MVCYELRVTGYVLFLFGSFFVVTFCYALYSKDNHYF